MYWCYESIRKNGFNDDNIVLWALNAKKIEVDKSINKAIPIVFVKPSYHGNPNLGAQKGLFTLWEFITYEQQNNSPEVTPLDIYLKNNAKDNETLLYKLKLPSKFVLHLYCMLSNLGYHASRVFQDIKVYLRRYQKIYYTIKLIKSKKKPEKIHNI